MRRLAAIVALVFVVAGIAGGAGYWFARRSPMAPATTVASPSAPTSSHQHGSPSAESTPAQPSVSSDRRILYYRNPMGLPDISPVPKKDSMGMDYIPVHEGEEPTCESIVTVRPERVQILGVRTEPVARRALARSIRAVGTVRFDESRLAVITTKFGGWIERLHVNVTGAPVRRGQALMEVYSPELVQAQEEYRIAQSGRRAAADAGGAIEATAAHLVEAAQQRLRNLDLHKEEFERLEREGTVRRDVTLRSPFNGVVLEKAAVEGMRFAPGDPLYRLVDASAVWVFAEVFEQDVANVAVGQTATIRVKVYPARVFVGRVAYIYPTVDPATRTARVRIKIPNPKGELKADMVAEVELAALVDRSEALTVPDSAVIDSGARQVVLIARGEGLFEPRPVRLGARGEEYIQVVEGVREGEAVVVRANFLIDAESNLKAALAGFTACEPSQGHQHP